MFVRHGTTPTTGKLLPGRAKGLHLAPSGVEQAEAVALRIAELGSRVAAIYSSPLERARETAAPIAKALGLKVVTDKDLLECDFGDWTGKKLDDLRKLPAWDHVQRSPSTFRFPHGESIREMQSRIEVATARYLASHAGKVVIAVSHADPIKAALADALGVHLDQFQRFSVNTCSVSAVQYRGDGAQVLAMNITGSLSEVAPA